MTARLRDSHAAMEQKVKDLGTAYAQLEQQSVQLEETQSQLVRTEKLAALGQLAGGVAHDLRNPLGAIKNAIYYLNRRLADSEESKSNPRILQFLNIISDEVDHANQIITDLLAFTRIGALCLSPTNLEDVLEESLAGIELKEHVTVVKHYNPDLPEIMADGEQLQRVFSNLMLNAQEAMPQGGELSITTQRVNGYVQVVFADTGGGISDEVMKSIFEPLFTTKIKGTGLGLSVCHQVMSKHGGEISVASREGEGATFTVQLLINPEETAGEQV